MCVHIYGIWMHPLGDDHFIYEIFKIIADIRNLSQAYIDTYIHIQLYKTTWW
jgi:hypothetical protein